MLISVILLAIPVTAAETAAVESDCVYYFFGKECKDCNAVDTAVYSLEHKYEHLQIEKYEVYHNFQNFELLQQYYDPLYKHTIDKIKYAYVVDNGKQESACEKITHFLTKQ